MVSSRRSAATRAARVVLLLAGLALATIFVASLIFDERAATASPRLRFVVRVVAPAMSAVLSLAALRLGDRGVRRSIGLLAALAGGLLATEILVALTWFVRAAANDPFDPRDRFEVVQDLREAGIDAVPSVEPKTMLTTDLGGRPGPPTGAGDAPLLALAGVANRHTVVCNETGAWVTYESDRFGMNNPDGVWDEPEVPLAIVGDAFAAGWCSAPERHFVGVLRRDTPRLINVAQSGNGPLLALASLVEYLRSRRPAVVLWFFYELNDLQDLRTEGGHPRLRRYLDEAFSQGLLDRQPAIDRAVSAQIAATTSSWRRFGNLQVAPMRWAEAPRFLRGSLTLPRARRFWGLTFRAPEPPADFELLRRVLVRAREEVESWGGALAIVYLPAAPRYMSFRAPGSTYEERHREVRELASDEGIDFVDIDEVFAARGRPLALFQPIAGGEYGHYTTEAHRLVAAAVLRHLSARAPR